MTALERGWVLTRSSSSNKSNGGSCYALRGFCMLIENPLCITEALKMLTDTLAILDRLALKDHVERRRFRNGSFRQLKYSCWENSVEWKLREFSWIWKLIKWPVKHLFFFLNQMLFWELEIEDVKKALCHNALNMKV